VTAQDFAVWTDNLSFVGAGGLGCLDLETPRQTGLSHQGTGLLVNTRSFAGTPGGGEVWRGGNVGITNTVEQRFPNPIRIDGKTDIQLIIQGRTVNTGFQAQWFGRYFEA
jgi:hypothetical protein